MAETAPEEKETTKPGRRAPNVLGLVLGADGRACFQDRQMTCIAIFGLPTLIGKLPPIMSVPGFRSARFQWLRGRLHGDAAFGNALSAQPWITSCLFFFPSGTALAPG